jgi:hypothetical protein
MPIWEVEYTDQFEAWWTTLTLDDQAAITAAVELLEREGPALGRPIVDTLSTSRHPNMKELRPPAKSLRVLFAFDPRRAAILLIGGDKAGQWERWYEEFIPIADRLYEEHLDELGREGGAK